MTRKKPTPEPFDYDRWELDISHSINFYWMQMSDKEDKEQELAAFKTILAKAKAWDKAVGNTE